MEEWLGHRDFKTTLIHADYAPSAHETEMVERAFSAGTEPATNLSETEPISEQPNPLHQAESGPS
jgi:hypothetical protein